MSPLSWLASRRWKRAKVVEQDRVIAYPIVGQPLIPSMYFKPVNKSPAKLSNNAVTTAPSAEYKWRDDVDVLTDTKS